MRGEEVLSLGLAARGHLPDGGLVLSLGSHWKAIRVDASGRVLSSVSTLGGEMLFAAPVAHHPGQLHAPRLAAVAARELGRGRGASRA